jgi:methyltransferase (TIGR00027 family)
MRDGRASRTAVMVCQARAAADGRLALGRFADPVALTLLHEQERAAVRQVRLGQPPSGWAPRMEFESVRATAEVIVPRTVAIDDAVRSRPTPQLIVLGAGLDSRAWRMAELAGVDVFEVDHPASQADKRGRLDAMTPTARSVTFVAVDLATQRVDEALVGAGHHSDVATTWIWEGVVPYLRSGAVVATLRAISALSPVGSRLIVNYQSPSVRAAVGRLAARTMATVGGGANPWSSEPIRSTWHRHDMDALLSRYGFPVVTDDDLLTLAERLTIRINRTMSLRTGRVAVGDR